MQTIFTVLQQTLTAGECAVLVSVVQQSGSVPRGQGAQMLVGEAGLLTGTVGGGPAELDALRIAREVLHGGAVTSHRYVLRQNPMEDVGAVCGGEITVVFHRAAADDPRWSALCTDVLAALEAKRPGYLLLGEMPRLSAVPTENEPFLPLPAAQRALIFGAGHCALALCPVLHAVGFRVTVFDDRPALATRQRFPAAEAVLIGDFAQISPTLTVTAEDYAVVMTSGHSHDEQVERQLLPVSPAYLGVIGSRAKAALIAEHLRQEGFSEAALSAVCSPIGLDIGAVTPEEIAVSIAGEMIRIRAQRQGKAPQACPMQGRAEDF